MFVAPCTDTWGARLNAGSKNNDDDQKIHSGNTFQFANYFKVSTCSEKCQGIFEDIINPGFWESTVYGYYAKSKTNALDSYLDKTDCGTACREASDGWMCLGAIPT